MFTQTNKDTLKEAFIQAFMHNPLGSDARNALYIAALSQPNAKDVLCRAGEPARPQCDRFGGFIDDRDGHVLRYLNDGGRFIPFGHAHVRADSVSETLALTPTHDLHVVYHETDIPALVDTSDWYFVITPRA